MKDYTDPSYSEELDQLPNWDRSFWLSRAYLEASQCLCSSMIAGDFSSQYSSTRVVLHLARHGIELFLKAAIELTGIRTEKFGHNLSSLYEEYWKLYPDHSFYFLMPSRFMVSPTLDIFPEVYRELHATLDQRHRYGKDRKGNSFATPEVFEPQIVLRELEELRKSLVILEWSKIKLRSGQSYFGSQHHTAT